MDAAGNSQDGKFAQMVKRIWNGPQEEAEDESQMKSERANDISPTRSNFTQRGEVYGGASENGRTAPPEHQDNRDFERPSFDGNAGNSTVISKGTSITGNIKSDGDVQMFGTVTGSINATGSVKINGKQIGDVQGSSISLTACTVRGSLSAAEDVNVDSESVIVGDIKCGNLTFDGKLKGNIHVMGNVNCQGNSIVLGDVASTTITVDSGAKLQGKMQISDGSIEQIDLPEDAEPAKPEN